MWCILGLFRFVVVVGGGGGGSFLFFVSWLLLLKNVTNCAINNPPNTCQLFLLKNTVKINLIGTHL